MPVRPASRSSLRRLALAAIAASAACQGSISCNSCTGGPFSPIPGGFPEAARIDRAAQIRLTQRGLDFIETEFQALMQAYVEMSCGQPDDVPCPTAFRTAGGAPNPSSCNIVEQACVEQSSGQPGPLVGFEIDQSTSSGAVVCRDDINDPNRRRCYAWLRFEGLGLVPSAPNNLQATVNAQIETSDIPFRYDTLGMDCVVRISSNASGAGTQDLVIDAVLDRWTAPSGAGGGQLKVDIAGLTAAIPDDDVAISRDPVHGDILDAALCGIANLGVVKNALIPRLTGQLEDVVQDEVDQALGWRCGRPGDLPCPSMTSCNTDGFCEEAGGALVPVKLGFEGRVDLASILADFSPGRPGEGDAAFVVGGNSTADATGLTISTLGGVEVVTPDPTCAMVLPSPRTRPGWTAPPALPGSPTVDLDFDGTAETPFMVAAGISEAVLDQLIWSVYSTGLICARISSYEVDLLNTGSLGLIIPPIAELTHNDRNPKNIFPARLSLYPRNEPQVTLGSGQVRNAGGGMPELVDPLIELFLDDLEIGVFGLIEERWVRLMNVTLDFRLGFGAIITPSNEIQLVLGDIPAAVTVERVENAEILGEDPMEIADRFPGLLELALPQITGALPPFQLPSAMDLGGFELDVLGIRGVEDPPGTFANVAVYADLDFDPTQVPNLSLAAETRVRVKDMELEAATPAIRLAFDTAAPAGRSAEHQVRLDGGPWSLFYTGDEVSFARKALWVEGKHQIEVRSRVVGDYRSLDPTPEVLDIVVDRTPPGLVAEADREASTVKIQAYDLVSRDHLHLSLGVDGQWREIVLDRQDRVFVPELSDPSLTIAVAATDEAGHRAELVVRPGDGSVAGPSAPVSGGEPAGCSTHESGNLSTGLLAVVALLLRRRRR